MMEFPDYKYRPRKRKRKVNLNSDCPDNEIVKTNKESKKLHEDQSFSPSSPINGSTIIDKV